MTTTIRDEISRRANEVADDFDSSHQPRTTNGLMVLNADTYLDLGGGRRVRADLCTAEHTRAYLTAQAIDHAQAAASWSIVDQHTRQLLTIQEEYGCTLWTAEEIRAPEEGPAFAGLTLINLDGCFSCRGSIWECHERRLDFEGCCEDCDHYAVTDPGAHRAAALRHLNESAPF